MKPESRLTIHAGANFILVPMPPVIDKQSRLRFQELLEDVNIPITHASYGEKEISLKRENPYPLEIRVILVGPQIGQLLIVAPELGGRSIGGVGKEAEDVVRAFTETWAFPQRQILSCDATIRDLYDTTRDHAFQELWEGRLKQSPEAFQIFGRPVLGGGLRFVMPNVEDGSQIEVKIESWLRDTSKLFIETQFAWPNPQKPGNPIDPEIRLNQVDNYIQNEVVKFVMEGQS